MEEEAGSRELRRGYDQEKGLSQSLCAIKIRREQPPPTISGVDRGDAAFAKGAKPTSVPSCGDVFEVALARAGWQELHRRRCTVGRVV